MSRAPFGPRLRRARVAAELSVEAVALSVDRSYFTIKAYERGTVEPPVHVLAHLAQMYGTTLDAIVADPGAVTHA